jgi:hypothetical protein
MGQAFRPARRPVLDTVEIATQAGNKAQATFKESVTASFLLCDFQSCWRAGIRRLWVLLSPLLDGVQNLCDKAPSECLSCAVGMTGMRGVYSQKEAASSPREGHTSLYTTKYLRRSSTGRAGGHRLHRGKLQPPLQFFKASAGLEPGGTKHPSPVTPGRDTLSPRRGL